MYGSVARTRVKPGRRDEYLKWMTESMPPGRPPGGVTVVVLRADADPDELWTAIVFESKEAYQANSSSAEMQERYKGMSEFFAGAPEWHDGEVMLPWS